MNRKSLLIGIGLVFTLCITMIQGTHETANAGQECRIIRLQGADHAGGIRLEPEFLTISKGGCIIWTNWIAGGEVQVIFEEGKTCEEATDVPIKFIMTPKNCYVTIFLEMGQTSSLRFLKNGTYRYTVETNSGQKIKGTILVENN